MPSFKRSMLSATVAAVAVSCPLALCSAQHPKIPATPRVTVDAGTLEGRVDTSRMLVFHGIPYAAPPVGDLRWRAPQVPARWKGVRSATELGHNCMQLQPYPDIDPFAAGMSEDCLYLNVTTSSTAGRRPVMVWIHGGGFFAGFGGEQRHDGAVLARKGAVVVTVNYRLGPFGFLAHPSLSGGNYGLLDQIAALDWVRRNIARFGGDPARVTIFGESAGAMSVGALLGSPLAKGLFRNAILESGTASGPFVGHLDSAHAVGVRIASALGVSGSDASSASRLRALSADSLLAATARVAGNPARPILWPTIDGTVLSQPVDSAIVRGAVHVVPVIIGSNAGESQSVFGAPARALARLVASRGTRAYLYQFARVADDSINAKRGAYHSAEITFVFGRSRPLQASAGHTAYDATLADAMSDYWLAFATSGDPNGAPAKGKWPRWPAYERTGDAYIELGPHIVARTALMRALYDSLDAVARTRGEIRP